MVSGCSSFFTMKTPCVNYIKIDDFKAIMQLQTHQKNLRVRRYVEVSKQRENNPLSDGIRDFYQELGSGETKALSPRICLWTSVGISSVLL